MSTFDPAAHLSKQGWKGKGTALKQGHATRPLAVVQKKNLGGIGKDRDEAVPFWDQIFAATAAAILTPSTSGTSTPTSAPLNIAHTTTRSWTTTTFGQSTPPPQTQTPRAGVSTAARISKEQARRGLYSRFMRGKVVEPEPEPEVEAGSSESRSEASKLIEKVGEGVGIAGPSSSNSKTMTATEGELKKSKKGKGKEREGETKDEKRARKAEKVKRKEEREARRALKLDQGRQVDIPSLDEVEVGESGGDMGGGSKMKRKGEEIDGLAKGTDKAKKIKKERNTVSDAGGEVGKETAKKARKEKKSKKDKTTAKDQ